MKLNHSGALKWKDLLIIWGKTSLALGLVIVWFALIVGGFVGLVTGLINHWPWWKTLGFGAAGYFALTFLLAVKEV